MSNEKLGFKSLILALSIFDRYVEQDHVGTQCEHDELTICGIDPDIVSKEDKIVLDQMGFFVSDEYGEQAFKSFRWGSC